MRGVLPAFAGVIFLLGGYALTWLVATLGYTSPCRLSVELNNYLCWGLMGFPLATGIGIMAMGVAVSVRGIIALPLLKQVGALKSPRSIFVLGLIALAAVFIVTIRLFFDIAGGLNVSTFLFVTSLGIVAFMGVEWVQIYVHSSQHLEDDLVCSKQ